MNTPLVTDNSTQQINASIISIIREIEKIINNMADINKSLSSLDERIAKLEQ